ncbi:MAG: MOSC domain-containing protein [Chloroflexota bacterium]
MALWRYPVKSMMGEELNAADLTERGIHGDRAYALIDSETGKVASAKNPRKWPNLFDHRASFVEPPNRNNAFPPVRITLPDGSMLTSDQPDINRRLSAELGREVTLTAAAPNEPELEEYWPNIEGLAHNDLVTDEAMPHGTFFDLSVLHILTTATLDRLRELYPQGRFEPRRFRPNIIIDPNPAEGFAENEWIGTALRIGADVRVQITGGCPRCVMTTLPQVDLPKDPGILRAAAQHNDVHVGVYAKVIQGGRVQRGDRVALRVPMPA